MWLSARDSENPATTPIADARPKIAIDPRILSDRPSAAQSRRLSRRKQKAPNSLNQRTTLFLPILEFFRQPWIIAAYPTF
jgi:hypothetical protein